MTPPKPNNLLKASSPDTISLGVRASTEEWREGHNSIQRVTLLYQEGTGQSEQKRGRQKGEDRLQRRTKHSPR
jgi:hypothetical protein